VEEAVMQSRFSKLLVLGAAAALAAAFAASAPAAAQSRMPTLDGGPTVTVGGSRARGCYEAALARSNSVYSLRVCDSALRGGLTRHNVVATYVNRSIVRNQRGDLEGALEDLTAAASRNPDMPAIHMNFGEVYTRLGRWREADAAFTRGIELGVPAPHRAYFGRAIVREELGDLEGAYADFVTASELSPDWELPRYELQRFQLIDEGEAGGA
jgi:tetratricopeptide (TPR) repeat protein